MLGYLFRQLARVTAIFQKNQLDEELAHEWESHAAMLAEDNVRKGMSAEEARRSAHIQMGGMTQLKEAHRDMRGLPFAESIVQDLRYAVRTLRRDPAFTTFAILILGLGIGATSTIFSVVNALLLQPLPFKDARRLVWISNVADDRFSEWRIQVNHFLDLREKNRSFAELGGYYAFYGRGDSKLTGTGDAERLTGVPVTQNFFALLGVHPVIGRNFSTEECKFRGPKAVILTHRLWTDRYRSDPAIMGRQLSINDESVTIVGVLPATFDFATVFAPGNRIDLFVPYPLTPETSSLGNTLVVAGRLKPEATLNSAQEEFRVLAKQLERHNPERNSLRPKLMMLEDRVSGALRPALQVLAGAVGLVMLIVCANLANLQLARGVMREKEMSVRAALGAGHGRLIRQMLTESVALSCAGAFLGLLLSVAGTRALSALDGFNIPLLKSVRVDFAVFVFTSAVAVVTGVIFGFAAALRSPKAAVHDALKASGRSSSAARKHNRVRSALVASEIAFACVLLICAGLLLQSFFQVLDVKPGFEPSGAAVIRVDPGSQYRTQQQRNAYFGEALRRVRQVPGISSSGLTDTLPFGLNRSRAVAGEGQVFPKGEFPEGFIRVVSDGYLQTMRIPLRAGRDFNEADTLSSTPVALVNETTANTLWPGRSAVGQMLRAEGVNGGRPPRLVVGVVGDVRHLALEQQSGCEMYLPIRQVQEFNTVDLVVRTTLPPAGVAAAVRNALRPLEPNLPRNDFRTLQQSIDRAISPRRFVVTLLTGFSLFALALAALGIYAVIAYSVNQRRHEFGIRMALGASAAGLQRKIVGQTLRITGLGLLLGTAAALLICHALKGLLFGVSATDPLTFLSIACILAGVAALAGYLPALRVSRVNPGVCLRSD